MCSASPAPSPDPDIDPDGAATAAAAVLADRLRVAGESDVRHDVAVVLGSGWGPAARAIGDALSDIPMAQVPGFSTPSASGHLGTISSVAVGGRRVLVLQGRIHGYEGNSPARVVHPIRTAAAAGVGTVILTNAAGGLRADMRVGQPVLISDHLNLTAATPLSGARFVDMVDAYSHGLRERARGDRSDLTEGVYAGLRGPQYETPAEIRMLRTLGADLVGMSTVHETIAARAAGLDVLGISLVTNLAAGMTGAPLDHGEVLAAGRAAAQEMGALIAAVVGAL